MSLYNKYNPNDFHGVVGNTTVVEILQKLLDKQYFPNGIIFSGIHGIGKTVLANLFARAINGINSDVDTTDIVEIDGATYTSIDNIRQILDASNYVPMDLTYKVFIIDEVHMLSRNAFDALLMTLHNPPDHVRFLFATTNINKLPQTFLSRCLHLPLVPLDSDVLMKIIHDIAIKENLSLSPTILKEMAILAHGSIRQAISFLEIALLVSEDVLWKYLKIIPGQEVENIFVLILNGKSKEALQRWHQLKTQGYDEKYFLHSLSNLLDVLSYCKLHEKPHELLENYHITNSLLLNFWDIVHKNLEYLYSHCPNVISKTIIMMSVIIDNSNVSNNIKLMFKQDVN